MKDKKDSLLLVMSDDVLAHKIKAFLEEGAFLVEIEGRSEAAIARILSEEPELVLLEMQASKRSALQICREIRGSYDGAIVILSTRKDEIDEILGLELGADDYFDRPESLRVLQARLNAVLRRNKRIALATQSQTARHKGKPTLALGLIERQLVLNGHVVVLSESEFKLLYFLVSNRGIILTREALCRQLLGKVWDGSLRSIDLRVSRLRTILGDSGKAPHFIRSVRGTGYYFAGLED